MESHIVDLEQMHPGLLDGAHHGNEYAGGGSNATVRQMLRDLQIHVVPVVNPDGWVAATRYNGNGVNLNRNYDIDWGNPLCSRQISDVGQGQSPWHCLK